MGEGLQTRVKIINLWKVKKKCTRKMAFNNSLLEVFNQISGKITASSKQICVLPSNRILICLAMNISINSPILSSVRYVL